MARYIPVAELGFDKAPPPSTAGAVEANRIALKLHRAGDHHRAKMGFTEALDTSPTFDIARFNLACAHAGLDEHDDSARELRSLLRRDLPEFGHRLQDEEDLEAFRDSAAGRSLLAELETLYTVWDTAIGEGVPTVLHWPQPPQEPERRTQIAPFYLRPGVFLREHGRFLPATPLVEGAAASLVFPAVRRAVVVVAGIYDFQVYDDLMEAWETGKELLIFELPHRGNRPMRRRFPEQLAMLRAEATSRGGRFERHLVQRGEGTWDVVRAPFELLTLAGAREDPDQSPFTGPILSSGVVDGWVDLPEAETDLRITALGLTGRGDPIALGEGHGGGQPRVIPSPDGRRAVAMTTTESCDSSDEIARAVVDLVDLEGRSVARLTSGHGRAVVAWHGDGTLYLQLDAPGGISTLRVWPPGAEAAQSAPAGVLLRAPIAPESDCSH